MADIHDWGFLMTPVLIGSITLVVIALLINNIREDDKYPVYWIGPFLNKYKQRVSND